jgi:two-component system, OmpR family, phosphate regulon response regulator PhoB
MNPPTRHTPAAARRILIVDPERADREQARASLDLPDLQVEEAVGLRDGIEQAEKTEPDVVITELVLADGSGFALCRSIRESERLASKPIVLVSRWFQEPDRILAFECGADDFVAKPYFARELVSRVRAVLRRSAQISSGAEERRITTRMGLVIDSNRKTAWVDGAPVPLSPREFSLLETLALCGGRVLSRADLMREAWKAPTGLQERSVDAHIKSLRRKLGSARDVVETVRGLGYRFAEEGSDPLPDPRIESGEDADPFDLRTGPGS